MTTWAQRAKVHFLQKGQDGTTETTETPLDFLQKGQDGTTETTERGVSRVSVATTWRFYKNSDFQNQDGNPAANDPEPTTTVQSVFSKTGNYPKLLAAAKALDAQILAAGGTLDLPPDKPKQAKKEFRNSDENSTDKSDPPKVRREDPYGWLKPDAPWRPLAAEYLLHHTACVVCQCAGQGRGLRCGTGSALWIGYQSNQEAQK